MKTAILTDSNSGISSLQAKEWGLFMLPMAVILSDKIRWEGVDLFDEEFFGQLKELAQVTTSMPSPGDITDLWDKIFSEGYEEIVYIPMSSGLSSSCSTSAMLAEDYGKPVYVVDNHRISVGMRESVLEALDMASAGMDGKEIQAYLEETGLMSTTYLGVDTLEYFRRGGRITTAGATLASVLNLKPVLKAKGEVFDSFAKVRGMKRAKSKIVEALREEYDSNYAHLGQENIAIGTAGSGLTQEQAESWRAQVQEEIPDIPVYYTPLSYSISCHTGFGAYGAAIAIHKHFSRD